MNNLNSVLLEGNLCRDPDLRVTPKGTPVCTLVVASNRSYKVEDERQEEVSFIETTAWGKLATVCADYLKKGRGVRVVGRLKQDRWQDPEGNARSKVLIVAEHVEFQPPRRADANGNGSDGAEAAEAAKDAADAADAEKAPEEAGALAS